MLIAIALATFFLGAALCFVWQRLRVGSYEKLAADILKEAERQADQLKNKTELALKEQQLKQSTELEQNWKMERQKLLREEERLQVREDKLEERLNLVEKKLSSLEKKEILQRAREKEQDLQKKTIDAQLEKMANISAHEAKELLFKQVQDEIQAETSQLLHRAEQEALASANQKASTILSTAINRLAVSTASEMTTCTVALPSEEIKGRIIGREGRNIRALEKATGVNFLMDDTPHAIVISGFDPIRKAIAKNALTDLIADGRIHPTRIDEATEKATQNVQLMIRQHGEDAIMRIGALNMHPELIQLLGKLKFRYSLGQNVLDHSLEVAHLLGLMAGELGLNVALAKRIGLLHDIGKAVSHEMQGTHALVGHDLALKWGEKGEVANGIGCHHFEMDPITIEGSLCSAADAISASRPGSRIEAVDEYVKRLTQLEELAAQYPGVEKAYALQAGREIRVIAHPDKLSDDDIVHLARNLTKKIETELNYHGKIKVSVFREKRVVDYAM